MRAGTHDREISIHKKSVTPDATYGTEVITWVPLVALPGQPTVAERFRAEVQDALPSRSEAVGLGLVTARNQTRIRMRWRRDVTSDMRITVHGDVDVIYQIVGGPADIEGRKERIEMVCEKYS